MNLSEHYILSMGLALTGVTSFAVILAYTLFAPWWETRSGRAVFALYWTFALIIIHFAAEALWGQGPAWREYLLLALVEYVTLWNGYVIISKQVRARRNKEEGH